MKDRFYVAALGAAVLLGSGSLRAQIAAGRTNPDDLAKFGTVPTGPQAMQDKLFMRTAAEQGLGEINIGQLAAQKGSSADVKLFAQAMVKDHTQLNANLKPVADAREATTPKKMSKADQAEYNKLNGLSGADFDKEYLAYVIKDQKKESDDFGTEAANTQDPALKDVVSSAQSALSSHLSTAQKLAAAQHGAS